MRIGIVRTASSPCRCAESLIRGLTALGHAYRIVDSEEIALQAERLARECDLVIDHSDTFRGRGLHRGLVRVLLEDCGARVAGTGARECFFADNKAAVKARLSAAGIPVPPGITILSAACALPAWLKPPLVLKPAFEHMSRGLCLVHTVREARSEAARLLESLRQPVIAESFIAGRELAISLIDGPEGIRVLPIAEWELEPGRSGMLTEAFKLMDAENAGPRMRRAELPEDLGRELEALARRAFRELHLRDYGRFDVRVSPGGTPFFLEANTTPSLEPMEALAVSAQWAGLDYAGMVACILAAATDRHKSHFLSAPGVQTIAHPAGSIEIEMVPGACPPAESSAELARLLDVQPREQVLELGCGTGLLAIAAARLGAARVVATDLDPRSLQSAERNALRNAVGDRIDVRAGSWYEALGEGADAAGRYDVIVATPPQTPGPSPFGPKYGGPDGLQGFLKILERIAEFLIPETGRLWMVAISLADLQRLRRELEKHFTDVTAVHQTERIFAADEYESLEKGLFDYLCALRHAGVAEFRPLESGRFAFRNVFLRATGLRRP